YPMDGHCVTGAAARRDANARAARVKTASEDAVMDERVEVAKRSVKLTVSLRTTFSHLRRMAHRGQSFQRTGARGGAAGTLAWVGGEDSSGQSTALTRRGLIVLLFS